jgi:hypothetical protein
MQTHFVSKGQWKIVLGCTHASIQGRKCEARSCWLSVTWGSAFAALVPSAYDDPADTNLSRSTTSLFTPPSTHLAGSTCSSAPIALSTAPQWLFQGLRPSERPPSMPLPARPARYEEAVRSSAFVSPNNRRDEDIRAQLERPLRKPATFLGKLK